VKWCQEKTLYNGPQKVSSFLCNQERFFTHMRHGTPFLRAAVKYLGIKDCFYDKEMVYQNKNFLQKYQNSKILIIGAGPSFKDVEIDYEKYDYIWSCNHFYMNEKLNSLKIDFVTLGNENNLQDKDLLDYLDRNETIICFENKYTKTHEIKEIYDRYPNRVLWSFTRYHSRIGSIPRLASMACLFNASEISFIGMDGYVPKKLQKEYQSSIFQENKKATGTIEDTSEEQEINALYKEQYLTFWDYMLHDIGKNISFVNLGHEHPCNLSTIVLTEKLGEYYQKYLFDPKARKNV